MPNTTTFRSEPLPADVPWAVPPLDSFPNASQKRDPLSVAFGQRTFDAEGIETPGRFFSRRITYPGGGSSGVTIGRGYDMGGRSAHEIAHDLQIAGVPASDARELSRAAGLRGQRAKEFVERNRDTAPVISLEAQQRLFEEVVTPELIDDIKRVFAKEDTTQKYGETLWDDLSTPAQELVFDLRYRGDYTPRTRERIQHLLSTRDYHALKEAMNDTAYWRSVGVPLGRIKERQELARALLAEW